LNLESEPSIAEIDLVELRRLSPVALAYLGDAVYELYVRAKLLFPPQRNRVYHQRVVGEVRAETQAEYIERLNPYLTEAERDIVRRARNAVQYIPRRLDSDVYRRASSFEALVGYLYLTDRSRLDVLLTQLSIGYQP
jgi:ribonuclease III family protein